MSVYLLNQFPPPSAVYRYALDINSAVNGSKLYTLLGDISAKSLPDYSKGQYVEGRFSHVRVMNKLLYNYSYRNFRRQLSSSADNEIIHYTHPMIQLDVKQGVNIVTFHDITSVLLNSDLFLGESEMHSFKNQIIRKFQSRYYEKYKKYENILTLSNYVRTRLIEEGYPESTKVIYPCISENFKFIQNKKSLKEKLGLPLDKICVLSVSTYLKRKNLMMVKKTMEILGDKYKLVRVGPKLLQDDITFPNVNNEELNNIYNACDVMLFPSLYEGFGYPMIESFATGLPVVASDIEVFREVSGEDAAILVDPNDAKGLAEGVELAVSTSDKLIENGFTRARRFSFKNFKDEINEYYRSILK